jgi:triacylglycerol esterase/lipase EstA (alpha/beta hydrolase family)
LVKSKTRKNQGTENKYIIVLVGDLHWLESHFEGLAEILGILGKFYNVSQMVTFTTITITIAFVEMNGQSKWSF